MWQTCDLWCDRLAICDVTDLRFAMWQICDLWRDKLAICDVTNLQFVCDRLAICDVTNLRFVMWQTCDLWCDKLAICDVTNLRFVMWQTCDLWCDKLAICDVANLHFVMWQTCNPCTCRWGSSTTCRTRREACKQGQVEGPECFRLQYCGLNCLAEKKNCQGVIPLLVGWDRNREQDLAHLLAHPSVLQASAHTHTRTHTQHTHTLAGPGATDGPHGRRLEAPGPHTSWSMHSMAANHTHCRLLPFLANKQILGWEASHF